MNSAAEPAPVPQAPPRARPSLSLVLAVFLLVLALVFLGLLGLRVLRPDATRLEVGQPAPDFVLETLAGERVILSELRGQGVVLNFWASWCDPCRDEAPLLERAWRTEAGRGIVVLGVAHLDQRPAALRFLETFDLTYPNGRDQGGTIAELYGIRGVPETYFIDPEGMIAARLIGPLSEDRFSAYLNRIRP